MLFVFLAELLLVGGLPFCASAEPDHIAVLCFPVYQSASRRATLHVCVYSTTLRLFASSRTLRFDVYIHSSACIIGV